MARIYISGLGADELLGGYLRHRKAWSSNGGNEVNGWKNLIEELQLDLDRLGERNLGW
jgi:asparagine synthetase B (glutamine-hydrolysing)